MHENILAAAARLSDDALHACLKSLALRERDATVELVGHLAELDGRRAHLGEGPGSVHAYCRDVLGYSDDAAWNRAAAANAVRRYPIILGWLADGSLNVTSVRILRRVLTPENHLALLAEARHRSKKEVEAIEARLNPRPDAPPSIRRVAAVPVEVAPSLPLATALSQCAPAPEDEPWPSPSTGTRASIAKPASAAASSPAVATATTEERYRIAFTVSKETHDILRWVQNLLCREIPDGDPAAIFERALRLLAREVEKKKLGAVPNPRPPRGCRIDGVHIPAHVRRVVWKRDDGRCAFVGRSGRCTEVRYLEWHHVQPRGHQGPATVENISLRCRAHNVHESELVFGPFGASVVRESRENYAVSREIASFWNGGTGTGRETVIARMLR